MIGREYNAVMHLAGVSLTYEISPHLLPNSRDLTDNEQSRRSIVKVTVANELLSIKTTGIYVWNSSSISIE